MTVRALPALGNVMVEGPTRTEMFEAFWEAFGGQVHVLDIDFAEYDVMRCRDCRCCVSCSKPSTCMQVLRGAPLCCRHQIVMKMMWSHMRCETAGMFVTCWDVVGFCFDKSNAGEWNVSM